MITLGIETSCDETAVAVLEGAREVRANLISSQVALHERYGGVVPELASRAHAHNLSFLLEAALKEAGCRWTDLQLIAVTSGPGLVGALLVGVAAAKGLSLALSVPLLGVHHIRGHVYANWLSHQVLLPCVSLVVSGGHTALLLLEGDGAWRVLGSTIDDAAGEAFDKVARALGLPYPGGPAIDQIAEHGDATRFPFPRALLGESSLDFSFSGVKAAVVREVARMEEAERAGVLADLAASFQEAVVQVLVAKCRRALAHTGVRRLLLAGGVAANRRLRAVLDAVRDSGEIEALYIPPPSLCTDNAAMIACAGYHDHQRGRRDTLDLDVTPLWDIGGG